MINSWIGERDYQRKKQSKRGKDMGAMRSGWMRVWFGYEFF